MPIFPADTITNERLTRHHKKARSKPDPKLSQIPIRMVEIYAIIRGSFGRYPETEEDAVELFLGILKAQGFKGSRRDLYIYQAKTELGYS